MKSLEVSREFKKKANALLEDRTKSHLLVELVGSLETDNTSSILPALHAVSKVIIGLIRRNDISFEAKVNDTSTPTPNTPAEKYSAFLKETFQEAWSKILELTNMKKNEVPGGKRIQELALNSAMQIIAAIHEAKSDLSATFWHGDAVKHFRLLLKALIVETSNNTDQIGRFTDLYLGFVDVKQYTIQGLAKLIRKSQPTKFFLHNMMKILEGLNFSKPKDSETPSTFLCPKSFVYDHEPVRKAFSNLWEDFMKSGNKDFELYKRILIIIHDKVMPNLSRPLLLTDFLMESYNVGGSVSLLALNGVFRLIQDHNLEYPEFYTKLYALLTADVLHVKYRARFFHLADLFLMSTHLPEYVVAAFIKRLSRLALTAPANALLMVIPFIGNLLLRHKGLSEMITRTCDQPDDPYDMYETDPSKCHAVESGLWEIRSLQSHVLPQVAQSAKFINKALPEKEWNINDYLEISMEEMLAKENKKRVFVNVPLTFERPDGFKFSKQDDFTSKLFDFV